MTEDRFKSKLKKFIKRPIYYDAEGQMIFGKTKGDGVQLILDVRGWGAIQHLFKDQDEAMEFQDKFGEMIAKILNDNIKI